MKPFASPSENRRPARGARWARTAVWLAAVLLMLAGIAPYAKNALLREQERRIGGVDLPFSSEGEHAWLCDIHSLSLAHIADSSETPARSPLQFFEDDQQLRGHAMHEDVRVRGGGLFSHWNNVLYFSTRDGTDPRTNGRIYTIKYPVSIVPGLDRLTPWFGAAAVLILLALGLAAAQWPAQLGACLDSRSTRLVLGGALAFVLFFGVWMNRKRYGITPDSASYAVTPSFSLRPPGYFWLMQAVTDLPLLREEVQRINESGHSNLILVSDFQNPVLRVVFAQRVLLAAAILVAFWGLTKLVPTPWAVVALFLVGQVDGKLIEASGCGRLIAVLLSLTALGLSLRASWGRRILGLVTAALIFIVARPLFTVALQSLLAPTQLDWLMSETLAMITELLMLAALALWLATNRSGWLFALALAAALAYLTRPAAIFCLPVVAIAGVVAYCWRPRPKWWLLGGALGLALLASILPAQIKKWNGAPGAGVSMINWAMATFALAVAEPEDGKLIDDVYARRYFELALPRREWAREKFPVPPGVPYDAEIYRLGAYMYQVVLPISQQVAVERFPGRQNEQTAEWNRLLGAMARPIYRARPMALMKIFTSSYGYMLGAGTRLARFQPLWLTLSALAVLTVLCWSRSVAAGVILCLAHLMHLAVVCMFDQPLDRYVNATEFLFVLGAMLILWGAVLHLLPRPAKAGVT